MPIKNSLDASIIKSLGKYSTYINNNGFLLFTNIMETKVPTTEADAWIFYEI